MTTSGEWVDPDDAPELGSDWFDKAEVKPASAAARRPGRPAGSTTSNKSLVSLRIDNDVLARFRATGAGWQSRMNEALRKVAP